jgi:potassium voltage-gated channel Shaker-related subfamily A protein
MWQTGGMGTHAQNNPWMKLMGIVHKERRHHDTGGGTQSSTTASNDRTLNQ